MAEFNISVNAPLKPHNVKYLEYFWNTSGSFNTVITGVADKQIVIWAIGGYNRSGDTNFQLLSNTTTMAELGFELNLYKLINFAPFYLICDTGEYLGVEQVTGSGSFRLGFWYSFIDPID